MADEKTNAPVWLWAYAQALERRYPDINVRVERLSGLPPRGERTGWRIDFYGDEARLIRHELVTAAELANERLPLDDRNRKNLVDAFGHYRFVIFHSDGRLRLGVHIPDFIPDGHPSERRVHTKKMQREVGKLLERAFALPRRAAPTCRP